MRVSSNQMEYAKQVGSNVKAIRLNAGITQKYVAQTVGMKPYSLSKIESGYVSPHLTTLKQIADALGRDIKDFL